MYNSNGDVNIDARTRKMTNTIVKVLSSIFGVIFLLVGTLFCFLGAASSSSDKHFQKVCIASVSGIVVDYETKETTYRRRNTSGATSYHTETRITYPAIVEYTVGDESYQIKARHSSGNIPQIGSSETIYYNPNDPTEAYVNGDIVKGNGAVFYGSGAIMIIIGILGVAVLPIAITIYAKKNG